MPAIIDDAGFWDRHARKYAAHAIKDLAGYERTVERTRHYLKKTDRVIELGCGTGSTALALASSVTAITGTDISGEMIAIAREKAAAQQITNADFIVSAAETIDADDESADAVLAFNILHLATGRPRVLAHALRLLKPGGLFISKTPCLAEMNGVIRLLVPVMQRFGKAPSVSFFKAGELVSDISGAGFTVIEEARHGSKKRDPRIFIVARKPA